MFFRNIYISHFGKLSIKNSNFLFTDANKNSTTVPIDDINSIVIDTPLVSLTSSFISLCGENGIAIYICDKYHLPNALFLPYAKHHKWLEVLEQQINWSVPYKKQSWKQVVEQKILNQKTALDMAGKNSDYISRFIGKVKSGDSDNVEATVASYYFKEFFGKNFHRRNDNITINALLNYGYALVRGNIARSLAAYGFIPALGLNHKNHYNGFNLVDDLLEPFRPIVDLLVFKISINGNDTLDKETRIMLLGIFEKEMQIQDNSYQVANVIDIVVKSLRGSNLRLPLLV